MAREVMDLKELCAYLKLTEKEVMRKMSAKGLPGQKVGGAWRFHKIEVDGWLQQRMQDYSSERLTELEHGVSQEKDHPGERCLVTPLLRRQASTLQLAARTRASVLVELIRLAQATDVVFDPEALAGALREREDLCSTALEGGVAIPHPRVRQPWMIGEDLLVVAVHPSGVPFGAPDGGLTDLFFCLLCGTDREHLKVLARLCRMLQDKAFLAALRRAETTDELVLFTREKEEALVATWRKGHGSGEPEAASRGE